MSKAQITFKLPTTRVNSANLAESEIKQVDVFDNYYGDDHGEEERRERRSAERADPQNDQSQSEYEQERKNEATQEAQAENDDGLEKQSSPHKRRRRIGQWAGGDEKQGGKAVFYTGDLSPGVHFFQLVAVDTEGREAAPSAPFRLNINEPGDTSRPETNDEPNVLHNVASTGFDDERPSAVTQVDVKLV